MSEEEKTPVVEPQEGADIDAAAEKLFEAFMTKMAAKQQEVEDKKAAEVVKSGLETKSEDVVSFNVAGKEISMSKKDLVSRKYGFAGSDEAFVTAGEYLKALFRDDKQKIEIMVEADSGEGGGQYLVPTSYASEIVRFRDDVAVIRPRATVVNVTTSSWRLPVQTGRPKVYWRSEAATKGTSSFGYTELVLTPYSVATIVPMSQELVDDASVGLNGSILNEVTRQLAESVAREEDDVFGGTKGTGTGKPTGIATYPTIPEISAGGNLSGDDLINAYYKLPQRARSASTLYWIMSSESMTTVRTLKDTNGRYLFDGTLTAEGLPTVLGRPVLEHNNLGVKSIFLGDLSKYYIADRMGMQMQATDVGTVASRSAFESNLVFIRVEERVDGELADTTAFVEITNV